MFSALLILVVLAATNNLTSAKSSSERTVGAWLPIEAHNYQAIKAQLQNTSSWGGLLDVVQLSGCGWVIDESTTTMTLNQTLFQSAHCQGIIQSLQAQNIEIHMWIGSVPNLAVSDPSTFIASTTALLNKYPFVKGIHFDDEVECAPRATLANFTSWINYLNAYSDALHAVDAQVSVAVQALFGIEDGPYVHNRYGRNCINVGG